MYRMNDPFRSFSHFPWWKPGLIITIVGMGAFTFWTLPNWGEFWSNLPQFSVLWQIPTNRRIIIFLTIKVTSPLLIMGMMGIGVWMSTLIEPFQRESAVDDTGSPHARHGAMRQQEISRRTTASTLVPQSESCTPVQSLPSSGAVSRLHDPETPLPPTLSLSEALRQQEEASRAFYSRDGQQAPYADQRREPSPVGGTSIVSSPHPIPQVAQPKAWEGEHMDASLPLISLRLLKDVSVTINIPGGGHVVVPLTLNAKRVQLFAYIAWRRGELIDRDKILEHVFGWGLSDEEATEEKLSERFESHKKLLRKKIREVVIEQINLPAGRQVIDPELDPFVSDSGFWGLSDRCRVEDLEWLETNYQVIALARKGGKLVDEIPEDVKEACERLIAQYPGDFLASLIKKYPSEFRPWQGRSSWVRKPYTHYRDYYLDALWYSAEYEWRMGQRCADDGEKQGQEAHRRQQQEHFGRAAQYYQRYAMYACNSRFDSKVSFGAHGQVGERIGMSERAVRRCVMLLGAIGRTDEVNQVWSSYSAQMKSLSDRRWEPANETKADVEAAKAQTNGYRFAAQISQASSELANGQGDIS